jgi:ATP-dependent RNA helicase HelY
VVTAPGRRADRLAVLSVSHRRGGDVRVRVVGTDRTVAQLSPADLSEAPATIGRIELPKPFAPRSSAFQREVALLLKEARVRLDDTAAPASTTESRAFDPSWTHPVADCPDRAKHLRALRRVARGERDLDRLRADLSHRSGSLSRQLDLVVELLEAWGYVDGWTLTSRGATLIKVFHESDLLVAEALADGLFDDLDGRSVAALASCFTYQRRAPGPAPAPWFPTPALRHRVRELRHLAHELVRDEQAAGLQATRSPDPGLLAVTYDWAGGSALDDVLEHEEVTPGDFVRQVRQLVDLLRQIGNAAERTATRAAARDAANAVFRGVVSAATAVEAPDDHPRAGRPDR